MTESDTARALAYNAQSDRIARIKRSLGSAEAALHQVLRTWKDIEDAEERGAELPPHMLTRLMSMKDKAAEVADLAESVKRHF